MALYLGLDSSTQSLTAVVIEDDGATRRVVLETSMVFDQVLVQYGTTHGVLPVTDQERTQGVSVSSPLMWADALDLMMGRLASQIDVSQLVAIAGSAQQHGSVYLNRRAAEGLSVLNPLKPLGSEVASMLSRRVSPIWMDASTSAQCTAIEAAVGGAAALARHTGSRAFERFTGPQIRKFAETDPTGYAATDRIHLVSSYLASLLCGAHAPLDPGDASGMNLMDLASQEWWPPAVAATAPDLASKLPGIVPSAAVIGTLSAYWQARHRFPPARVVAWSGDNPCSLVGVGLVREGRIAISLGTSDTIFGLMREPRIDAGGTGHVFGAPTGAYMGLTCFSNGSLARERVRDQYGLTWEGFSRALDDTPAGNDGRLMLPWFVPEITPFVPGPGVRRQHLDAADAAANVRAVVEAQMMAMALHSQWMGVRVDTIHATGGAAVNPQILQVMADVFGADVHRFESGNSAALGAALRALHADRAAAGTPLAWDDVVAGLAEPVAGSSLRQDVHGQGDSAHVGARGRIVPNAPNHAMYRDLLQAYAQFEASALSDS
jgi:xylulokinase